MDGHKGHYIRQYLFDAQSGCCAVCGGSGEWLGVPLALVLDHIDGNPTNNRGKGRQYRRQRYADGQSF